MYDARQGGLTGKARRAREETRSSRLYTRQLIAEFFDPETVSPHRRARPIRLGHRSEFSPSTVCAIRGLDGPVDPHPETEAIGTGTGTGIQLELPLAHDGAQRNVSSESAGPVDRKNQPKTPDPQKPTTPVLSPAPATAANSIKPIRPPRANQAIADPTPFVPTSRKTRAAGQPGRPKKAMTLAGFFYGCVLGGAAAAAILLALHFVVG